MYDQMMQLNLTPNPRIVGKALTYAWSWRANFALWIAILARGWSPCDSTPSMLARAHKMANRLNPRTLIPPKSEINPPKENKEKHRQWRNISAETKSYKPTNKHKHRQICKEREKNLQLTCHSAKQAKPKTQFKFNNKEIERSILSIPTISWKYKARDDI